MSTAIGSKALDERGKLAASRFLTQRGYQVLEQGWCSDAGNVDLVATDDETLVFVEVKTRANDSTGLPEEVNTDEVRRKREQTAIDYLSQTDTKDKAVRFDTVSILVVSDDRAFLKHHINAFSLAA